MSTGRLGKGVRSLSVLALLLAWTLAQSAWLDRDGRLLDGDELGNVGALELFWGQAHAGSVWEVLGRAYTEDFGEYPALYPAVTGALAARAGVEHLGGDGPAKVGLVWGWLCAAATAALAAALALRGGLPVGATTTGAALLLLGSPLFSALQRHVMLENGVAALVALAAAAVAWARVMQDQGSTRRLWALWVLAGLAAAGALLVKQTAVLALAPLAVASVAFEGRGRRPAAWGGPAVAAAVAVAVAAPWYLGRLGQEGGYLLRSAAANPDAVGGLHQAVYYPLVLLQQAWAPSLLAVFGVGWALERGRREPVEAFVSARFAAVVAALGVLALLLIPKKYARLLLPLLPFLAVAMALVAARWRARTRWVCAAAVVASWGATTFASVPGPLGVTSVGLTDLDERCTQRWIEPPEPGAIPWASILATIDQEGGRTDALRVGSIRWPVPPCAHQTTHDLGEHLRIHARRAGFEAWIGAGERWEDGRWTSEGGVPPQLLLHEGLIDRATFRAACRTTAEPEPIAVVRYDARDWPLEVAFYPCSD